MWTTSVRWRTFVTMAATTTPPTTDLLPKWTVADRLRKAREDKELDQAELASRIGVARSTISNYEGGKVTPRKPILRLWAMETDVPLDWLLDGYGATSDLVFTGNRCTRPWQPTLWESAPETGRAPIDFGMHAAAA